MSVETGNLSQLAYVAESQFGTTPATPVGQLVRFTDLSISADANYIDNPEFRKDNMKAVGRRGALRGKGSFGGKMSYGTVDDFMAAFCGQPWAANVAKIKDIDTMSAGGSVSVMATGKTFTRASGSYITDGFAVGDVVQWAGFANAANNVSVVISTLTATVMTCTTATGLVDEATVVTARCSTNCRPSFTFEKGHLVNGIYFPFTGVVIDGFTLSGKVNDAVDFSFDVLTKAVGNEANASVFSTLTAVNTNPLMTAWDGSIKRAGVAIANVVSWSLKGARNSDSAEVCGSSSLYDIQPKAAQITGSLELYFDSAQAYTDFRAETDLALQINIGPGGTKSYTIDLTKCRYKNWKGDPKDGLSTVTVDFESFAPDSGTNTSFMLTRLP